MNDERQGDVLLTTHITLPPGLDPAQREALGRTLDAIGGLTWTLRPGGRRLQVRYDVTQTGLEVILRALNESGLSPPESIGRRLWRGWALYREQNARANARAPAPACCNHPPTVPK